MEIEDAKSDMLNILTGVPQGSFLGPTKILADHFPTAAALLTADANCLEVLSHRL